MPTDPGGFSFDPGVLAQRAQESFGEFLHNLGAVGSALDSVTTQVGDDITQIQSIVDDFLVTKENLKEELQKLRDFEFNPHWKTRVINVPIAINQIRDLLDEIFNQLRDKLVEIFSGLQSVVDTVKTLHETRPVVGTGEPTGLARVVNQAESIAGYVNFGLTETAKAMDAAKDLSELFIDITQRIESLSDVFLKQGNPRQRLKGTITARVGKLHR